MQRDGDHIPFVDSGSYPLRAGNAVVPLIDGENAFRRICEAVAAARRSVWVTVAFHAPEFRMPDEHGDLFDVLDRARERGLDVRVIFWRHLQLEAISPGVHFSGTAEHRRQLAERGSRFLARWDQAHQFYCQHQKSWLIDAGAPGEVAFVGGINLDTDSVVAVGHPARDDGGSTHDVYVEVRGPAASDVHHNFVQRWNESSDRGADDGCWPEAPGNCDLPFPVIASPRAGAVPVQIQRTVRRERYADGTPAPGARYFDIAGGEFSVADQYKRALETARRTIYIEDQAIGSPEVVERLLGALARGVEVVFLVPIDPNREMAAGRKRDNARAFWDALAALGESPHFTLAGIAANRPAGGYQHIYVHAKIALVDDTWATIGSCNIGNRSFYGDTELNASFWHGPTVRTLRVDLLREHLGADTADMDDVEALRLYARLARANADRYRAGERLEGLAVALDPATYAL